MHVLKRRLYKRGSSYEVTIPIPLLFNLDLKLKHDVIFDYKNSKWNISVKKSSNKKAATLKRKLYRRGSSYETTIPLPIILPLDPEKRYLVLFKFDGSWFMEFAELKYEKK